MEQWVCEAEIHRQEMCYSQGDLLREREKQELSGNKSWTVEMKSFHFWIVNWGETLQNKTSILFSSEV